MRLSTTITVLLLTLVATNTLAFETNVRQKAMFYVNIPLDGSDTSDDKATFGFRLDNVDYTNRNAVDFRLQLRQPAVIDFRMDRHGIDGIYVSGTDYLQLYKVSRQNDESAAGEVVEEAEAEAEATAEEEYDDGLTMMDHVKGVLADMRAIAPMGIWMGAGLGVGLLIGVDD